MLGKDIFRGPTINSTSIRQYASYPKKYREDYKLVLHSGSIQFFGRGKMYKYLDFKVELNMLREL